MLTCKLLQRGCILRLRPEYLLAKYSQQAVASKEKKSTERPEISLGPQRKKIPTDKSILQALFTLDVNETTLEYPETQSGERHKSFFNWLKPIENYILACSYANQKLNKKEVLNNLTELGVFQAHLEEHYGYNLSEVESLKLIETASALPWLSTYLVKNHLIPLKIISKYGSESQKQEYYPRIRNNEIVPVVCINEGVYGTNVNNIKSHAIRNDKDEWLLNGDKTFVVNGVDANLFLVFARTYPENTCQFTPDSFSLFLVEKNHENVVCREVYDTISDHNVSTCTISFKDAVIPNKNVIGKPGAAFPILMEMVKPGQTNIASQTIGILRNFTDQLIIDVLKFKQFDRDLYQFDYVKATLGEILLDLYTMESMAYMTSGMIDKYENVDVSIEKVITEKYCATTCLKCIQMGVQLLGAQSYLNDTRYTQTLQNALALTTLDMNNIDANTYIATSILVYFGKLEYEKIHKMRNPNKHPFFNMLKSLSNEDPEIFVTSKYVHPSLQNDTEIMEQAIYNFRSNISELLVNHGSEIMTMYRLHEKITDMITEIYGAFATLSRASRSYATGLQESDIERHFAKVKTIISRELMEKYSERILNNDITTIDNYLNIASDVAYSKHKYFLAHPLDRTI